MSDNQETRVNTMRHKGIFDPSKPNDKYGDLGNTPIAIIGLGNIGSNVAVALAKMGLTSFTLIDADTVESHNLSSQAYWHKHIDMPKTDATVELIMSHNPAANVRAYTEMFTHNTEVDLSKYLVIMAVDSLEARSTILSSIPDDQIVIDGRMGQEQIEVHVLPAEHLLENLPTETSEDPCAEKFISYTAMGIAALIASKVKKILNEEQYDSHLIFDFKTATFIKPKHAAYGTRKADQ